MEYPYRFIAPSNTGPVRGDPLWRLTGEYTPGPTYLGNMASSDHRLVWVDLRVPAYR